MSVCITARCTHLFTRRLFANSCVKTLRLTHIYTKTIEQKYLGKLKTMKLQTENFKQIFTPELQKLLEIFENYKHEIRIAGGAVRDLLMDKVPHDIDFATTATPEEMIHMFETEKIRMINANGLKHGTVTARINDKENFEVTTLRIDVLTDGRRAKVEFTKDWQLDANRRDLTINAMFLGFDGTVYDYFTGFEDIENRRVRFVGDATERIQEDYLRILRYFRFYGRVAKTADEHDTDTLRSIQENVGGMEYLSGERIWMELRQILTGRFAEHMIPVMVHVGMASYMGLPSEPNVEEYIKVCKNCQGLEPNPITLLSALLYTEDQIYELNKRLKVSTEELKFALFLVENRQKPVGDNPVKFYQDLICDTIGSDSKVINRVCELLKYSGNKTLLDDLPKWNPPKFPVSGGDLISQNVPKGPVYAVTLKELREIWKNSNFTLKKEDLLEQIDSVVEKVTLSLGDKAFKTARKKKL